MIDSLILAFQTILSSPFIIFLIFASVLSGVIIGVLPGLGVIFGIVVLLPFTLQLQPEVGIVSLMSIFVGSAIGGGLTASLIGIPGTPMAVATLLDAHPLVKKGKTNYALGLVIFSSIIGGIFSALVLAFISPYLADIALNFGPSEYVLLITLGLTTVAFVSGKSIFKGLISGLLGLSIATIGTDLATAETRFTFGIVELSAGFNLIAVLLGLFAIPEVISLLENKDKVFVLTKEKIKPIWPNLKHLKLYWFSYFRSSTIGTAVGALPGAGADIGSFMAYSQAKRFSKNPSNFGKGDPEGVIASESANNAVCGGALIPTLTLGIPGDAATAIIVGVLYMHGLAPGPELFLSQSNILAFIYAGLILAYLAIFVILILFISPILSFLKLPKTQMIPTILLLCFLGVWAIQTSYFDLWTMIGFGFLSYFLKKMDYPLPPIILGFILGPLFEQNLRRAMTISDGDILFFINRPYTLGIFALLILVLWGAYSALKIKNKK